MTSIAFFIPGVRLVNETNTREHWSRRASRARLQRRQAMLLTLSFVGRKIKPPMIVYIWRIGPRSLDSDNLAASGKHVRDGIADALGVNDNDPRIDWRYLQERRGGEYGVRVEIVAVQSGKGAA